MLKFSIILMSNGNFQDQSFIWNTSKTDILYQVILRLQLKLCSTNNSKTNLKVPFNLIPRISSIKKLYASIFSTCKGNKTEDPNSNNAVQNVAINKTKNSINEEKSSFEMKQKPDSNSKVTIFIFRGLCLVKLI